MIDYKLDADLGEIGTGGFSENILHIAVPELPQFRFEWHTRSGLVYVVRVGVKPETAEPITDKVRDQPTAEKVVQIWCSGYCTHRLENVLSGLKLT